MEHWKAKKYGEGRNRQELEQEKGQEAGGHGRQARSSCKREENIEAVISQQAPLLLLHTAWRRGLKETKVHSNWRCIKHTLISTVTQSTRSHLIHTCLILTALYCKLNFHNLRVFWGFTCSPPPSTGNALALQKKEKAKNDDI